MKYSFRIAACVSGTSQAVRLCAVYQAVWPAEVVVSENQHPRPPCEATDTYHHGDERRWEGDVLRVDSLLRCH